MAEIIRKYLTYARHKRRIARAYHFLILFSYFCLHLLSHLKPIFIIVGALNKIMYEFEGQFTQVSEPISSSDDESEEPPAPTRTSRSLRAELQQQAFGAVPAHDPDASVDDFLMAGANRERSLVRSHSGAASSVGSGPESPTTGSFSGGESPASAPRRPVAHSSHQPQRWSGGGASQISSSSPSGHTNKQELITKQ